MPDFKGVFEGLLILGIMIGIVCYVVTKFLFAHVSIIIH